jgi:hypothetical protein
VFYSSSKKEAVYTAEVLGLEEGNLIRSIPNNGKFWFIENKDLPVDVLEEVIEEDFLGSPVIVCGDWACQFGLYGTETEAATSLTIYNRKNSKSYTILTVGSNSYEVLMEAGLLK